MSTATDILARALELSEAERAAIAHHLLLSLETEPFDDDSEALWAAEIEARLRAFDEGRTSASDWRQAVDRIRASLSKEPPR